jgi:hypothetical protein
MSCLVYPTSIHAAAKILDIKYPNWHNNINIRKLNMDEYHRCILGQLWGDYYKAMYLLFDFHAQDVDSGYAVDSVFGNCRGNKQRWIEQIELRKTNPNYYLNPDPVEVKPTKEDASMMQVRKLFMHALTSIVSKQGTPGNDMEAVTQLLLDHGYITKEVKTVYHQEIETF